MGLSLIQFPSFEDGDARLATVLRDNDASALAQDGHPLGSWYPGVCRDLLVAIEGQPSFHQSWCSPG